MTTERTLGRECVLPLVTVTVQIEDLYKPIGIFGKYKELVLNFREKVDLSSIKVWGQDLAGDHAIDITDRLKAEGYQLTVPGELIQTVGLTDASEGDESLPGMVLQVFKK